MTEDIFRTNEYKEWVQLQVSHSREWETEPGHVGPETFMFNATNTQSGKTGSVILTRSEAIALRDWLVEHIG